jgi:hypothetical protein
MAKVFYEFVIPQVCYTLHLHHPPLFDRPYNIWWEYNLGITSLHSFLRLSVTSSTSYLNT